MRLNNDLPVRWAVWFLTPDGVLRWFAGDHNTEDFREAKSLEVNAAWEIIAVTQMEAAMSGERTAPPWSVGLFPLRELEKLTPSREGEGLRS